MSIHLPPFKFPDSPTAKLPRSRSASDVESEVAENVPAQSVLKETSDTFVKQAGVKQADLQTGATQASAIPEELKAQIERSAAVVFGEEQASEVSRKIFDIITNVQKTRPPELLQEDFTRESDWYKDEVVYTMYPERFGVKEDGKPNTFRDLIPMLPYLKDLGATTIQLLPPFESPKIDAGFDISNYKKIRAELGGNEQFEEFLGEARKLGLKVKLDLVLNHVSDQHSWVKKALSGDSKKLNYFLVKDKIPPHTLEDGGKAVAYQEEGGLVSKRVLVFPDISTEHYRKMDVQGKEKFFYHTFYPHQLDVNHENPEVLYKFLKVMGFWANRGVDIFRLDAVPFYVKTPGTNAQGTPGTHAVVQILSSALQAMSPRSVLWAEACESPEKMRPYYGEDRHYEHTIPGYGTKPVTRSNEAQIAYHFPLMSGLWSNVTTQSPKTFWQNMKDAPALPESAALAVYHGVHDGRSLDFCSDSDVLQKVYKELAENGEPFREGFEVCGRLASFMKGDTRRINLMNSVLTSLQGIPMIYYGDEMGETNNRAFMQQAAKERELQGNTGGAQVKSYLDTRDIHRAPITAARLLDAMTNTGSQAGQIRQNVKTMIGIRKQEKALTRGNLVEVPASQENILSYVRTAKDNQVLVVHNLSDETRTTNLQLPSAVPEAALSTHTLPDLLSKTPVAFTKVPDSNEIQLTLPPYQSVWLKMH